MRGVARVAARKMMRIERTVGVSVRLGWVTVMQREHPEQSLKAPW